MPFVRRVESTFVVNCNDHVSYCTLTFIVEVINKLNATEKDIRKSFFAVIFYAECRICPFSRIFHESLEDSI